MKSRFLFAPLLVAVAGCHSKPAGYVPTPPPKVDPIPATKQNSAIMPLDEGNEWTFGLKTEVYQKGKQVGESNETVTMHVDRIEGNQATLSIVQGTKLVDRQVWQTTDKGIYQVVTGLDNVPFQPAQPVALFPMDKGRNFTWAGKGQTPDGKVGFAKAEGQILAPQDVDTGIGTLSAIPVATAITYGGKRCDNTTYFRPGIGMVRLRQEFADNGTNVILTLTLSRYALKK